MSAQRGGGARSRKVVPAAHRVAVGGTSEREDLVVGRHRIYRVGARRWVGIRMRPVFDVWVYFEVT